MSDFHDSEDSPLSSNAQRADEGGKANAKVGYKNPPAVTRFQKGRSGNPRGRPRKVPPVVTERQERAYFFQADAEPVWVTENGKRKQLPGIVALYRVVRVKALQGEFRFAKLAVDLRRQFVEDSVASQARQTELMLDVIDQIKRSGKLTDDAVELLNETRRRIHNPLDP